MSYNLTTMQSIHRVLEPVHYISPTVQAGFINFAPNYTARNTTKLEFTFVPGTFNGSAWVGHMGVTPDILDPDEFQEGNIYRLISYENGEITRLDVQGQMENLSTVLDSSTPKLKVEMWDYGINIWNDEGTLIETHTWTSGGTWDSGIPIFGWPVKEENQSGVIEVLEDFKLYSVKITDDVLGVVYDGTVDASGLYDSVSQTYTTTTGWTIGSDLNNVKIMRIMHNNSLVYPQQGDNYYITPTAQSIFFGIATNYTVKNTTKLEYVFVPGNWNGDVWVGNMGINPLVDDPFLGNDDNDFRLISYDFGANTALDVHDQRNSLSTTFNSSSPKMTVEMWDNGINIWNDEGTLIETQTFTSSGTWDSGISVYVYPRQTDGYGGIQVIPGFKLYSVKITDDNLGVIYNGTVDASGLYDSVSQTYTTTTGWTIGND